MKLNFNSPIELRFSCFEKIYDIFKSIILLFENFKIYFE